MRKQSDGCWELVHGDRDPYIEELSNFQFEQSGSGVRVEFDCTTVYGKGHITWEAKGVKVA